MSEPDCPAMLELDELETGCASSLLDSGAPSQLLEEGALQLQVAFPAGALGLSLSQASIANARSDAAESPHTLLMNIFFMKPLLFNIQSVSSKREYIILFVRYQEFYATNY
jgi:hypothetical protein